MAELSHPDVGYSPRWSLQIWKTLVNWLSFFYHILLSVAHHPLLSSSTKPSTEGFKPLPTIELHESPTTVEITEHSRFHRLKVVLDLDETLICAYETSSLPSSLRNQAIEGGLKWFDLECLSSDKECNAKPKINYVTVFERPGLHEFLEEVSQFADLVLFTAGLEGYARPLVDRIDTRNVLSNRLYRPSTVSTAYRDHVKDLLSTSRDMSRTVIVDNNPFSFLLQPSNGIPCVAFSAEKPNDAQLLDVILPLLKQLSEEEDVRPVLYDRFHMTDWFEKQGIPPSCWNH